MSFPTVRECPCGTGTPYDACCGKFHRAEASAATAEELMRSRYSAYAVGDLDYVFRTWHPRTRPENLVGGDGQTWIALEVLATEAGQAEDTDGIVEFRAHYTGHESGVLIERSKFTRRAGRWVYVSGDVQTT